MAIDVLPDINEQDYAQYQADQFSDDADRRLAQLRFETAANQRLARLNSLYESVQPTTEAPPAAEPTPTQPPDLAGDLFAAADQTVAAAPPAQPATAPQTAADLFAPTDQAAAAAPEPAAPRAADLFAEPITGAPPEPVVSAQPVVPVQPGGLTVTPTTAELSGGGAGTRNLTPRAQQILADSADIASWLGPDGQKALQAILVTEGGMNNARGDNAASAGPLQFFGEEGGRAGQLNVFARDRGLTLAQARTYAEQNPAEAVRWAIGTPDAPGYLGKALANGQRQGLTGADLATYAQHYGQVSVSPERAGANYSALFGAGEAPLTGVARAGAALQTAAAARDISQFGDPQLTNDEAYAACGPAAAVRFAERYGRNPTLREAVDLAKTVNWTPQQGMAGIDSEAALMDKLGVPVRVVRGPQWGVFAEEAKTGNPVTISTQGHYFTADGYDPATNRFHVGRSGLDLRGGAEWMTPEQMTSLMGPVQGGLLADNPQVAAPSTADQPTNPLEWLGRQKDALISSITGQPGPAPSKPKPAAVDDPEVQQLDQAVDQAAAQPERPSALRRLNALYESPSLGETTAIAAAPPPPPDQGQSPQDRLKSAFSDFIDQVGSAVSQAVSPQQAATPALAAPGMGYEVPRAPAPSPGEGIPLRQDVRDLGIPPQPTVFEQAGQVVGGALQTEERQRQIAAGQRQLAENLGQAPDLTTSIGQAVLQGAEQQQVQTEADVRAGQALAETVIDKLKQAGWNPTPDEERIARQVISQVTPMNVLLSVAGPGESVTARALLQGLVGLGLGAAGGTGAAELARSQGLPQEVQDFAQLVGSLGAPLIGFGAVAGTRRLAELPSVQRFLTEEEGALRIPGRPAPPPAEPAEPVWNPNTSSNAANRDIGRMLEAEPTQPEMGTFLQRRVRELTNRFEAADRFQEQALREAGINLTNPPEQLDLSALIREQAADPAAELRIQRDLKPIIRSVGGEQQALTTYLIHQNNIDVANMAGDVVQAREADRPVAQKLTDDVRAAQASLTGRQRTLQTLQSETIPDEGRIAIAQRSVNAAQRTLDRRQAAVDAARQQLLQEATAAGQEARSTRAFSGGLRVADSERGLVDLERELGPRRFANIERAAQRIYTDYLGGLRQTMVDSGVISPETAAEWQQRYPHWVPTRILDYLDEGAASGALRTGTKIGVGDTGIHQYTLEGTEKFRENPLGSIISLTHQVETKARRNAVANAFVNLDQLRPENERLLQRTERPATAQEPIIQRINNGTVERYIGPPDVAAAVNGPMIEQAPGFVRWWTNLYRNLVTVVSPAFALVRNPTLDIPEYFQREFTRAGGNPVMLPRIAAALVRGYADAFQGLLQQEMRGPGMQQFIAGGGGHAGMVEPTVASRAARVRGLTAPSIEFGSPAQVVRTLAETGGHLISSPEDLKQVVRQLATLRPVAAVAERTEAGPRIASMRLAQERTVGKGQVPTTPARATLAGRTVTMDFNEGGTLAKTINSFIPFFNVGIQGSAQLVRAFRENPRGFLASTALMVGAPAMLAEIWNQSDPKRRRDLADVPDYLKDLGVVIMLPYEGDEAPVDKEGNRRPPYWWINMRAFGPFVNIARQVTDEALRSQGQPVEPADYARLGESMLWSSSPIRANTFGDLPGSLTPEFFPGASAGLQLALNRDIFRRRQIVSQRADVQASQASREIADALTSAARTVNPEFRIHPSQVEFVARNVLGGVGASGLGVRQFLPGAEPPTGQVTEQPFIGGLLRAAGVGTSVGQVGATAREQILSPDTRRYLQSEGIEWVPGPVPSEINRVPLTSQEEGRFQVLANRYINDALREMRDTNDLRGETDPSAKLRIVQRRVEAARKLASYDVMDSIPDAEWNRRRDAAEAARHGESLPGPGR
jgi:hypothetical protein